MSIYIGLCVIAFYFSKNESEINYEKNISINKNWKDILLENNLGDYIEIFEKNKLTDINIIMGLNESDLEKLGINVMGDRKNILKIFSYDSLGKLVNKDSNISNFEVISFEDKWLKEIEDDKKIYESELYQLDYKILADKLTWKYPISTMRDIEKIEKKYDNETAKKVIIKMLLS